MAHMFMRCIFTNTVQNSNSNYLILDLTFAIKLSLSHGEKFWTRTRSKYTDLGVLGKI